MRKATEDWIQSLTEGEPTLTPDGVGVGSLLRSRQVSITEIAKKLKITVRTLTRGEELWVLREDSDDE